MPMEAIMGSSAVKRIQQALLEKGFLPGVIDGIWGRQTISAVKAFQVSVGLLADGIVGPRTSKKLFGGEERMNGGPVLPWMIEAEHLLGTKEAGGDVNNPVIMHWADNLDLHYSGDDVPWCGLFVGHCIASSLPEEVLPGNVLGARQWGAFGDPTGARRGAVMVFWRGNRSSGLGHVGFYTGESDSAFRILAGNQSNQVSTAWVDKDHFLEARWPISAGSLGGGEGVVRVTQTEKVETAFA
jgi:uncharacterized protein (TIGR02594 family)